MRHPVEAKGRAEQQSSAGKLQEMLTSKPDPAAALCATAVAQVLAGQSKVEKTFFLFQVQRLLNQPSYLKFDIIILSYH